MQKAVLTNDWIEGMFENYIQNNKFDVIDNTNKERCDVNMWTKVK